MWNLWKFYRSGLLTSATCLFRFYPGRRVCAYPGGRCEKNAIMGGMCKKHYDRMQDAEGMLEMSLCIPVRSSSRLSPSASGSADQSFGGRHGEIVGGQFLSGGLKGGDGGSRGELSGDGESVPSSPSSSSAMYGIRSCPSWGSAAPVLTTVPSAVAMATPLASNRVRGPRDPESTLTPSASAPNLAAIGRHYYRRSHGMKMKQPSSKTTKGHQRGLSIFDEMHTVDAIINSGSSEKSGEVQQPQRQGPGGSGAVVPPPQPPRPSLPPPRLRRQSPDYPPRYPQPPVPSHALPTVTSHESNEMSTFTKTPASQVSFANCKIPRTAGAGSRAHNPQPCTGDSSCTCDACRSPTLAIFEQMIMAAQKVESGDLEPQYAGLSPPKLGSSPRKLSSTVAAMATSGTTTPSVHKQVSFLPEEPSSTGSVVRQVSSTNIAGQESWESAAARREDEERQAMHLPPSQGNAAGTTTHGERQQLPQKQKQPASSALATTITFGRTVSRDVDDGQRYHRVHPSATVHERGHGHAPQDRRLYSRHRHQGHSHQQETATRTYKSQHHNFSQRATLPPKSSYHHSGAAAMGAPRDFYLPQTPTLHDTLSSSAQQHPISVDSAYFSANRTTNMDANYYSHHHKHLLPKPRENRAFEHLFVPKQV